MPYSIAKSEEDFLSDITVLINILIINPKYIQVPSNIDNPIKAELQKLNCKIEHTLDGYDYDKTLLRKKMMDCISFKYKNITVVFKCSFETTGHLIHSKQQG